MARARTVWRCRSCDAVAPKWYGRCPECAEYGTFAEGVDREPLRPASDAASPVPLAGLDDATERRTSSGVHEFDRVLGGGFVTGSLVLLGGEPGIGKSTILLQVAARVAGSGGRVLYACGEESCAQVGMRARRIGAAAEGVDLVAETDIAALAALARETQPALLIVDSIQTAFDPQAPGVPGSVGQVRSATSLLARVAKDHGVTTVLVGHVTKDGVIAGPRVLEHMVDAVLYFEGDREHAFRLVRAVKNRFGPVSEIGIFEMTEHGLAAVSDPTALLLGERRSAVAGSVVMAAMEGSRPLLVEIQALVTPTCLQ
ncbi:MAG TPA: AAA family ATPase, partial [Coriobacteriia bacterium]|nr:AAA family ATPase [Coriobacteriia bacterium]